MDLGAAYTVDKIMGSYASLRKLLQLQSGVKLQKKHYEPFVTTRSTQYAGIGFHAHNLSSSSKKQNATSDVAELL